MPEEQLRVALLEIGTAASEALVEEGVGDWAEGGKLGDTLIGIKDIAQDALRDTEPDTTAEAAYRRGWQHGLVWTQDILLPLVEKGFTPQEVKFLFDTYNDHFVAPWRSGDHEKFEVPPGFSVPKIMDMLHKREKGE